MNRPTTNPFAGVRGRVTLIVLAVSACLYSLLGTIGFFQMAASGRDAIHDRITVVLDQLEAGLRSGERTVSIVTPDGVAAQAQPVASPVAPARGDVVETRAVHVGGATLLLVGRASQARLNESLHSLWRALWIAIPAASLITAVAAGLATRRALRPVAAITALADTIGEHDTEARVPVPDTGDEIAHLAATVNRMLERIAAGRRAQQRFSSDAAHELRTPLMALQGELELARLHPEPEDTALLSRLETLSGRLADRVDDLLLLSTLDEGRAAERRRGSLVAVIEAEAAASGPWPVEVRGGEGCAGAEAMSFDPVLVARAVRNLLANAQRHAGGRVSVTIEASRATEAAQVRVHVDDDGPGIDPCQRELVLRRFARLDDARSQDRGGAGLGLAIVASVAEAHGGHIEIDTSPDGGARFTLDLPVHDPA